MLNLSEISDEMDALEAAAHGVLLNLNMTPLERRLALNRLLSRYHVLEQYKAAFAAFIRRMRRQQGEQAPAPEKVVREILGSLEFGGLRLALLAALIAVTYGGGPRAAWVPLALVPMGTARPPGLRL